MDLFDSVSAALVWQRLSVSIDKIEARFRAANSAGSTFYDEAMNFLRNGIRSSLSQVRMRGKGKGCLACFVC